MAIVVYTLDALPGGGSASPPDVNVGPDANQQWLDPDDGSMVGVTASRPTLDAAGLLARAQSIHARHPITNPATGDPYTDEALEAAVADWISAASA